MIIEYLEFDINSDGKGLMFITCTNGSYYYYLGCGVFNNKGLKFDLAATEILGCCDSEGVEPPDIVANFTSARHLIEECFAVKGAKTMLKNIYWKQLKDADIDGLIDSELPSAVANAFEE